MVKKETLNNIASSEESFASLFSAEIYRSDRLVRYHDELLKDMYDHNFSFANSLNDDDFRIIEEFKEKFNESFIKISSSESLPLLIEAGFERETLLTMAKEDYQNFIVPEIDFVRYVRVKERIEAIEDLIRIEKRYYGPEYGEDFCERRWKRYLNKILEGQNGLDIWVVYKGEEAIAYCYSYYFQNTICLDALLVIEEYRNKYVASNLIKEIASYYDCPIFLHADDEETPKEMYKKLGFEIVAKIYDYLKVDK
ncbi:MAG: GNAT family N-acetyltransferase [Bacilli bacterium]|nr:GNAT family N-acetyltransferase [Bacilli bacterium]